MAARFTTSRFFFNLTSATLFLSVFFSVANAQCPGLGSITFNVVAAPSPTLDFPASICNGQSATISVNETFESYLWNTGSTASSITVSQSGTYIVTVTNTAGCDGTASATISANPNLLPTITGPTTVCPNNPIVVSAAGGFTSWLWSNGETTPDISVSSAGTYAVTVTDANGCTGTDDVVVTAGGPVNFPFTALSSGCGQFTLEVGAVYPSYLWSTGSTDQSIIVTQSGPYAVTVTDAGGCTGSIGLMIVIPPPAVVQITGGQSICTGSTTTLTASAGFVAYSWSNGGNAATNTINQPGTYTVTATDGTGCTATATTTISSLPEPVPELSQPAPICGGETATISVTNPIFQNYNWSNGGTGTSITVSSTDTYTVTVTDAAGCTGTAATSLTVNPSPVVAASQLPYECNGLAELSATPGFPTYAWSNGEGTPSITVNQPGSYSVTVTGASGCTATANVIANVPPAPQVSITGDADICEGNNAILSATPGFASYLWSTGQSGPSISVSATGTYFVTVTNSFSCTATNSFNVTAQPAPVPQITGPTQICAGGSAVFSATGGPFASYLWSNGGQTSTITTAAPGNYDLTVTDANGCTGTATVDLTVGNSLDIALTELPYQCNGEIILDAGAGFQSYTWSNGSSAQLVTVTSNGNFTVTVTDATGCSGSATASVSIPVQPQASISGPAQICEGESAELIATTGFANYLWSNGQQNPSIFATAAGTYAVTVTDFDGCQASASFILAENPSPQPIISGASTICQNSSTVLSTAGNFQAWAWSNGQTTPEITASSAGDYSVTVTNASGCTGTDAFQLNISTSLQPQIIVQPYACNGQLTLDAGAGFQTYVWSNGGASQTLVVSQNGNYSVTVSDAGGCTGTTVFNAIIPAQQQVAITGGTAFCTGGSSVLTASAGFQDYLWSNGTAAAETTVTLPGNYTVTATDANGCTSVATVIVTVGSLTPPQIQGSTTICNGATTVLTLSQNYSNILWSTGGTTQQITAATVGNYTVTVSDANGCSGTASVTVTTSSSLSPQIIAQPYACNGQLTLDAGAGFQTYAWSSGGASQTLVVSQNGNYSVTVSDVGGCTGTAVFNAIIPAQQQVAITGGTAFCTGGSSVLTASVGFQNYLWSNGTAIAETTVTLPGNYTVTATDANGCTSVATVIVTVGNLTPPQIQGSTTICNGTSTVLALSQNYPNILWSIGETTQQITASTAGIYAVTVSDAGGCSGTASVTVTAASSLSPQIIAQPYDCDGQLTLDAGAGFQTYVWSNGGASQTLVVSQNGNYEVTVSDAGGCTGTAVFSASIPAQQQVAITGGTAFCTGGSSVLTASASFQNYLWSNGTAAAETTVTLPGNYTVTATDANGCTSVATVTVSVGNLTPPQIQGSTTFCSGSFTLLSLSQGYPNILWSTGEPTQQITASTAGTYAVTVSDVGGCTGTASVIVTTASSLSPQITTLPVTCGLVNLDAGPGFASYAWSDGSSSQTLLVSQNGLYTVTVSDAGGCTGTASVNVTLPTPIQVAITGEPTICTGNTASLTATAGFVGYFWSNGATSQQTTITQPGQYSVTATDVNGCNTVAAFTVVGDFILPPQILGSSIICNGNPTTIGLSASYDNYLWSNGSTNSTITLATSGLVSVTVTNTNGCSVETSIDITAGNNLDPQVVQVSNDCSGLVGLGVGNAYETYLWSNGGTNQITLVDQTGTYFVTVTDANGCTGIGSIFAQVPQQFSVDISGNTSFCTGGSSVLTATDGFQAYTWSNGALGAVITVSQAGDYTVTVSDINGCTGTAQVTVTLGSSTPLQIIGSNVICVGGSTVLSIANASNFSQILWSNGSTASQITATVAGVYAVTATDLGGCTATESFEVTEGNVLAPSISEGSYNCDGNLTLEAPDGFQTYTWSTGSGTPVITVSQDGSYALTVTDASGCTGSASIFVQVPDELLVVVQTPPTPICPGDTAQLSVPPGFASYAWNTGESANAIVIVGSGNYTVTVTDQYGCKASDDYLFNFAEAPDFTIIEDQLDCESAEAVLELNLVDVSGSPTVLWSNGVTTAALVTAQPGVFTVTVTDGNGCTATAATEVLPQESFFTSFADTIEFVPGQVVSLVPPGVNFQPVEITWSPTDLLVGCENCPTAQARPVEDVLVTYSAVSAGGCEQEGTFFLYFKDRVRPSVYAPNAFSPDSPFNPGFTLYSNELVAEIKYLKVFTRWGEMVVELKNLTLNDPSKGWDGSFRGEPVDPGVFVWVAEVVYRDGSTEVLKGDITVIR